MARRCKILTFPIERARKPAPAEPKTARLHYDFGQWCVMRYLGSKRICEPGWSFADIGDAMAAIRYLVEQAGYELLPPSDEAIAAGAERVGGAA